MGPRPVRVAARLAAHRLIAHWRGWLALALLVGLAGGAVLAGVAGARRTDSAYRRYLSWSHASNVLVSPAGTGIGRYYGALARLPQVAAIAPVVGLDIEPVLRSGHLAGGAVAIAPADRRYGSVVDRPKILAGRLPSASRPLEIAVDQIGARELRVHVGSAVTLEALLPNQPPGRASGGPIAGVRTLR